MLIQHTVADRQVFSTVVMNDLERLLCFPHLLLVGFWVMLMIELLNFLSYFYPVQSSLLLFVQVCKHWASECHLFPWHMQGPDDLRLIDLIKVYRLNIYSV
jgi:hypothetical protein